MNLGQETKPKKALFFLCIFLSCFSVITLVNSCSQIISNYEQTILVDDIIDGDTFESNHKKYRILGIDTPETYDSQNNFQSTNGVQYYYGTMAKQIAHQLLEHKYVNIEVLKTDQYNRFVSKVLFNNNIDYGQYMVQNGWAIVRYIDHNPKSPFYYYDLNYINQLQELQENAKMNKVGFWQEPSEIFQKIFPPKN